MNFENVVVDVDDPSAFEDEVLLPGDVSHGEESSSQILRSLADDGNVDDENIAQEVPQTPEGRRDAAVSGVSRPPEYAARRKRRRSPSSTLADEEPGKESKSTAVVPAVGDSDKNCCCICLEPWTNSGDHRLVCLPCGHLLGDSCAKHVLKLQKKCPICKAKASYKHVRIIYGAAMDLRVVFAPELDKVKNDLSSQRKEYKSLKKKYDALKAEKQRMKDLLRTYEERHRLSRARTSDAFKRGRVESSDAAPLSTHRLGAGAHVVQKCSLHIPGQASALAFDRAGSILFAESGTGGSTVCIRRASLVAPHVEVKSPPFPATKVNCLAVCPVEGSSYRSYIAAGSSDKKLRVLDPNLHLATSFSLAAVPTSCTWLSSHPCVVLCGFQNGELAAFDISSSSSEALKSLRLPGARSASPAVHSLVPVVSAQCPIGCIFAASLRGSAVVSFGDTAGFTMDLDVVAGFDNCAAASSCDSTLLLSSRQGAVGKHSLFDELTRGQSTTRGEGSLSLGQPKVDGVIDGYSALAPFQRSACLRLRSGKHMVASNDGKGMRVWISKSASNQDEQRWDALSVAEDVISGPVRALSAMVPPRRTDIPPVLAVLCDNRVCTFDIWE